MLNSKSEALNSFSPLASPAGTPCRKRSLGTGEEPWGGVGGDLVGGGGGPEGGRGGPPPPLPYPTRNHLKGGGGGGGRRHLILRKCFMVR